MKKIDLENHKIESPFQVSEGYFDNLETSIQNSVRADREPSVYQIFWKWALAPAMILMLLVGYSVFKINNNPVNTSDQLIAQLSNDEILSYLEYDDITTNDIAALSQQPESLLDGEAMMEDFELEESDLQNLLDQYDLNDINIEEI